MSTKLVPVLIEEDRGDREDEGGNPMREVGAAIKKGQALSCFIKEFYIQTRLSFFHKYRPQKKARATEEGTGGSERVRLGQDIQSDIGNGFDFSRS